MQRSPYYVFLPVLVCALLWGSAFPCIKLVYQHWGQVGVEVEIWDRWLFAGVRFTLGGLGLLLVAKKPLEEWRKTEKRHLVTLSLGQTFFQYLFFYLGLSLSSGSLGALMAATGSFWWMLLAPLMLGTAWPQVRQWLLLCVGAVGVGMAVYAPGAGAGNPVLGALCIMASTFFGSLGVVTYTKIKETMGSRAATGFSLFFGGVALVLLAAPSWGRLGILFDTYVLGMTLWLAFVSAVGFAIWNALSIQYPVPLLASCRFIIPVCGVVQSLLFLPGESAGWGLIIGGVLVIGSMLYATLSRRD
ncbi:DMT family transporter [Rubritalea tangerina]|uniref:DMT family transporter n=1 Tax=Rubritalea tangerina TaxID=430798 RepID=A0ABW4ZBJ2_9BACT